MRAAGSAQVLSVETERVREGPPLPFDLGTLQEVCSKQLGLDVQETLDIAQALYETHKATTYPRSDSGYLPESMLAEVPPCSTAWSRPIPPCGPSSIAWTAPALARLERRKVTAHHGIIPTLEPANLSAMSDEGTGRLPTDPCPLPGAVPAASRVRPDSGAARHAAGSRWSGVGKQIAVAGWRLAAPETKARRMRATRRQRSQVLPALRPVLSCQVGQSIEGAQDAAAQALHSGRTGQGHEGRRQARVRPAPEAEAQGHTGHRHRGHARQHHQRLAGARLPLKKGRAIRASDAAFTLIDTVPAAIADPGTTAVWEQALDMIEAGQMTLDTFIDKQSAWVTQLVQQYRGASLAIKLPPGPACPLCGGPMRQRTGKSGAFWSCSRYRTAKGRCPIEARIKANAPRHGKSAPAQGAS
jgi:DNA topoisomerase-3